MCTVCHLLLLIKEKREFGEGFLIQLATDAFLLCTLGDIVYRTSCSPTKLAPSCYMAEIDVCHFACSNKKNLKNQSIWETMYWSSKLGYLLTEK